MLDLTVMMLAVAGSSCDVEGEKHHGSATT